MEKKFNVSAKARFCRLERWNQFGLDNRRRLELTWNTIVAQHWQVLVPEGEGNLVAIFIPSDVAENTVSELTWNIGAPQYTFL